MDRLTAFYVGAEARRAGMSFAEFVRPLELNEVGSARVDVMRVVASMNVIGDPDDTRCQEIAREMRAEVRRLVRRRLRVEFGE